MLALPVLKHGPDEEKPAEAGSTSSAKANNTHSLVDGYNAAFLEHGVSLEPVTPPIFLGTALKAVRHHFGWDLTRLSNFVFVPFFPIGVPDLILAFAVPAAFRTSGQRLQLRLTAIRREQLITYVDLSPGTCGEISQEFFVRELQAGPQVLGPAKPNSEFMTHSVVNADASHFTLLVPCPSFQAVEPSQIRVDCSVDEVTSTIGSFSIQFLRTPQLTPEELRAIRRRGRDDVATLHVSCKKCNKKVVITNGARDGATIRTPLPQIAINDLPAEFICDCGATQFETRYLKLGMHELLRQKVRDGELRLTSCYRNTAISTVLSQYNHLINSFPAEEKVQEFIASNPIMWSFLGAVDVFPKPRISTHFTPDFAISTPTKTLFFVEIEKPQTKLAKVAGGQSAELQAGKDQIDAWRLWIEDNRVSVLSELRLRPESVHQIKFILVAGLESTTPTEDLRAVRQGIREDTQFYTFDELAGFVKQIDLATKEL